MNWEIAFFIYVLFFIFLTKIGLFSRKGIILINEGKYGLNLMHKLSKRFNWNMFVYPSVIIGYLGSFFILYILVKSAFENTASVSPVIPGVRIPGSEFYLPFWYGLAAIFLLLVIHEMSHGIISNYYNVKVKSSGFGLLAILPFAFVKPDERGLNKLSRFKKMAIYSAGSFSNLVTGILALFLIFGLSSLVSDNLEINNLEINYLLEDFPIKSSGLEVGDKIILLDNNSVTNYMDIFSSKKEGESILLTLDSGEEYIIDSIYDIETNNTRFGLGFSLNYDEENLFYSGILKFISFLYYFSILSFGVGLFNLLPLGPIDGGKMFFELLGTKLNKTNQNKVFIIVSLLTFLLLVWSLLRPITQTFI